MFAGLNSRNTFLRKIAVVRVDFYLYFKNTSYHVEVFEISVGKSLSVTADPRQTGNQ